MNDKHTDREYENELLVIKNIVYSMEALIQEIGNNCLSALFEGSLNSAHQAISKDDEVDRMELQIDRQCINVIARRQPLGTDLRFIVSVQKAVTDLERIADLLVCIAERSVELHQNTDYKVDEPDLKMMLKEVLNNVSYSISAFLKSDNEEAVNIILKDRQIDAFHAQLFRSLMEKMRNGCDNFSEVSRIMTIISCAERIGDHAKNICEYTCYLATGRQISHTHSLPDESPGVPKCIVFLCVQNSARSQMAEGLAKHIFSDKIDVFSAGSAPADKINPIAVEVMKEIGIDISGHHPKRLTDIPLGKVDMVITLCSEEICINLPTAVICQSWLFDDPVAVNNKNERIKVFRNIRDDLKTKIEKLFFSAEFRGGR